MPEVVLLQVRQQTSMPTHKGIRVASSWGSDPRGVAAVRLVIQLMGDTNLPELILTFRPGRTDPDSLHCGEREAGEDAITPMTRINSTSENPTRGCAFMRSGNSIK